MRFRGDYAQERGRRRGREKERERENDVRLRLLQGQLIYDLVVCQSAKVSH